MAMVLWHTGDAWLTPALRDGQGWLFLRFVGGLAAPSFLFLAGVSTALSVRPHETAQAAARALRASIGRGLEVVLVGYLLRYQTWMIDAAAIRQLSTARAFLPLGLGYATLVWSVNQLADAPKKALWSALAGAALCAAGYAQVESVAAGRLERLLQVDVLQAIGMSLVLLALFERGFGFLHKPAACALVAFAVAACTHSIWESLPGPLPHALAAYLGHFEPAPGKTPASRFPLFPWFAYACLGASVGALLRRARGDVDRVTLLLAVIGAACAVATSEAHPYIHQVFALEPWLIHPLRVIFRVGVVLSLLLVGLAWTSERRGRVLLDYGKTSLRIYWAHMLFAYGVLGRPLQRTSGYHTWALWVCVLLAAMWFLAQLGARKAKPAKAELSPRPVRE